MKEEQLQSPTPLQHTPSKLDAKSGQSLVEFAIILPILLLMLLGVFEVGWALRGYLTLVNANREAARFGSRGVYLDFDQKDDAAKVGYSKIVTHTMDSLAGQLNNMSFLGINPSANAAMVVTYYSIEPNVFTCPDDANCETFDCSKFSDPAYDGTADQADFDMDALNNVEYPILYAPPPYDSGYTLPGYYGKRIPQDTSAGLVDHYEAITSYHYHQGGPYFSQIDPETQLEEFRTQNNKLNCERSKKGLPESDLKVIVVENVFLQEQLVGLPFVTAFVPNPIPLYTQTTMRLNPAARQETEEELVSCALYPIMTPSSEVTGKAFGEDIYIPIDTAYNVAGSLGFIQWNSLQAVDETILEQDLLNPNNAASVFAEPNSSPLDDKIGIGDWIAAHATTPDTNQIEDELNALIDTEMLFPVWNDSDCLVSGPCTNAQNSRYRTSSYARMVLTEVHVSGGTCPIGGKCLGFRMMALESNACAEGRDS